ncbi:hypothetical protein D1007_09037 [Hordeum vulgare]|nr:hypothetical protein D1007_09037 [Hordeum vulgare]
MIPDEFLDSSDLKEELNMLILMSMEEEMDRQVENILNFKGSIKGRRVINQGRVSRPWLLEKDYFAPNPTFQDDPWFRRRFRMRKQFILCIVEGVVAHCGYFKLTRDCRCQLYFCAKQKCTTALRMLALGTTANAIGELVRMEESTCPKTIVNFVCAVLRVFGAAYLREPNMQDTEKLLAI